MSDPIDFRRLELSLTASTDKHPSVGPRVVLNISKHHGLMLSQSTGSTPQALQFLSFMTPGMSSMETLSGSSKSLDYRYFPDSSIYFQLGYSEQSLNYLYTDCSKSCASPIITNEWQSKRTLANVTLGLRSRRPESYFVVGAEFGLSYSLSTTIENEKSYNLAGFDTQAEEKMKDSKNKFLENRLSPNVLVYVGVTF